MWRCVWLPRKKKLWLVYEGLFYHVRPAKGVSKIMTKETEYFENMYNVRRSVADHQHYFNLWAEKSKNFLKTDSHRSQLDVSYGEGGLENMDIFQPKGKSSSMLMFVHGGYWRSLDKQDHSFVAEPFVKAGTTVAVINYTLCPSVEISEICRQVVSAGAFLYKHAKAIGFPNNKMYVAGHSAGGHLATMALACLWRQVDYRLPEKVFKGGLSISGIYDLRALTRVPSVNADLKLSIESAARVSPAMMMPPTNAPLIVAVGGKEVGGFKDQHNTILNNWRDVIKEDIPCSQEHHFDILLKLAEENHPLCEGALRMLQS